MPDLIDTPIAPSTPDAPADSGASFEEAVTSAVRATLASDPASAASLEPPRDEMGRFVAQATDADPTAPPPEVVPALDAAPLVADPGAATPPDPAPVLPEGVVMPKAIDRPLVTEFTLRTADGDELAVPDVLIEFTAAGKTRKESLDKVVKLAQMGAHQDEREQRYEAIAQETAQVTARAQTLERTVGEYETLLASIVSDPTGQAWLDAHDAYAAANTPDAIAQREREAFQAERASFEQQRTAQEGQRFFEGELVPALDALTRAMPSVLPEEVSAKLLLTLKPFEVNGAIPPARYAQVRAAIVQDVLPWMRSLHEDRQATTTAVGTRAAQATAVATAKLTAAEAARAKAEAEAQRAKRSLGRAAAPIGRAVAPNGPPARHIASVDDAMESAIETALHNTLHRSSAA